MSFVSKRIKKGFTIAEVLIVLGIIGIIAQMTIPTLVSNIKTQTTIVSLKKIYSTLSQAYSLAVQENGTPDNWGLTNSHSPELLSTLAPYLKIQKNCIDGSQGCYPSGIMYKQLSGGNDAIIDSLTYPKIQLSDGTLIFGLTDSINCTQHIGTSLALSNECGRYAVDINGFTGPNQYGYDSFEFVLTKYGILPLGSAEETTWSFASYCRDKSTTYGVGCAAWVIYNENMDYLKCSDLSWGGKTTCN